MASDLGQTYLDARVAATEADDEARWQQLVGPPAPPKLNVPPLPEVPGPPVPGEPAPTMGLTITPQGVLAQGVPGLVEETKQPGLDFEEQRGRLYDVLGRERPQPLSAQVPQSGIPPQYVPENLDWIEGAMSNIHSMTPGRPGKPPPAAPRPAPTVAAAPVAELQLDPQRFQYKVQQAEGGTTGSLAGVQTYDPNLAGVVQVWRDPANGQTYVVNGHNRVGLAKATGQETVNAIYLDAASAEEARTLGALTNVAEGRGNALDAAKLFRDTGLTVADLQARGIPLREKIAADGLALANLQDSLFNDVIQGQLPMNRAIIIGSKITDHDQQRKLVQLIRAEADKGRRVSDEQIRELADFVQSAPTAQATQETLFGAEETTVSLALDKARIAASIRERLSTDKALFSRVGKTAAAERLTESGAGAINVEASQQLAQQSGSLLEIFDRLKNSTGPISDILNDAAKQLQAGGRLNDIRASTYQRLSDALPEALTRAEGQAAATGGGILRPAGAATTSTGDILVAEGPRTRGGVSEAGIPIREAPAPVTGGAFEQPPTPAGATPPEAVIPPTPELPPRPPIPEAPAAAELLAGPSPEAATRMNMARFSPAQRESGILELINQLNVEAGTVEAVATPITHAETIAASRGAITAEQLFSKPKGFLIADVEPRLQVVEADRILVRSERRLVDLAKRTAAGDTTAADLLPDALAVHSQLDAAVVDIGEIMGRGLEARKQVAEIRQPSALRLDAVRELADRLRLGGATPSPTPGAAAPTPGAAAPTAVQTLAAAPPQAINPTVLAQMILSNQTLAGGLGVNTFARGAAQAKGITFTDMVYEAWINGLLSNPESHIRNVTNGLQQAITGVPVRAIARTMEPGTEGVVAGEASAMAYAYLAHSFDMWKVGLQAWRANHSQFALPTKTPPQPAISGLGLESASGGVLSATGWLGRGMDLFGWLVRQPGRGMMAADDMLKYANYRAELHALAVRDGVQQGLSGQTLSTHIAATVANPPATVHQLALDYAAYSTYAREKGPIASWLSDPRVEPVMKWLNPFVRVQDNINRVSFEMVPGLNLAVKSVRDDLKAGGARADLAMAKMSLGSLLMAGAAAVAASGELTGAGPRDQALRAVWLRTHQPYSFKFPGGTNWYSYKWMGPMAMVLAIPATMIEMGDSLPHASWSQLAMGATLATGEMLLDPTWSTGLSNVMAAIREPETKGLNYLTTFASSFVPGAVGEIEKLLSPTRAQPYPSPAWVGHYDVRGEHVWKGVDDLLAAVAARVPGWSDKLPPSLDVWGNPRMQSFGVQAVSDDPVDQELLRLGIGLAPPSSTVAGPPDPSSPYVEQDRPGSGIPLRPWEFHDYVKLAGNDLKLPSEFGNLGLHDMLAKFITTEYYQKSLTDGREGTKADTIKSLASKYRQAAQKYLYETNDSLRDLVQQRKLERQEVKIPEPLRRGLTISR